MNASFEYYSKICRYCITTGIFVDLYISRIRAGDVAWHTGHYASYSFYAVSKGVLREEYKFGSLKRLSR